MLVLGKLNLLCLSCHNHEMGIIVVLVVVRISHYLYIKCFINALNKTHIYSLPFGGLPQVRYFVIQGNAIALHKAPLALPQSLCFPLCLWLVSSPAGKCDGSGLSSSPDQKWDSSFPFWVTHCWKTTRWPSHHANYLRLKEINILVVIELIAFFK